MAIPRRKIKKALKKKGFREEQGNRDHDFYFLKHEAQLKANVHTKVSRGSKYKDIDRSLLKKMSRQLHLSRTEFDQLVSCPMSAERYIEILIEKKVLNHD